MNGPRTLVDLCNPVTHSLRRAFRWDAEDVLGAAIKFAESKASKARAGTWGLIKHELYRPFVEVTKTEYRPWDVRIDDAAARARLAKL